MVLPKDLRHNCVNISPNTLTSLIPEHLLDIVVGMNNLTQLALASIYYYDSGLCVVSVLIGVVVDFR